MPSTTQQRKSFRAIGHRLKPVVTVAEKGITENVRQELERALNDHELIKVKLVVGDRAAKNAVSKELTELLGAECIQQIGHILLLYRAARKPDPRLSNLLRKLD
ncbi:MAG: YhbY family RNA-binding protein [Gammaproteobacteria bacterium]|nr:YhbY family RNA-binding protein [Pseudomonadales bacterium]MCP5347265.1 YhbY family RNA-binding protein [Pseudomonadales bacterium]